MKTIEANMLTVNYDRLHNQVIITDSENSIRNTIKRDIIAVKLVVDGMDVCDILNIEIGSHALVYEDDEREGTLIIEA